MPGQETVRFAASDGTPLVYHVFGPAGRETVLLCHGLGAGAEQFMADAEHFAALGYRVLVPDLRGHGHSGIPERIEPSAFSPQRLAGDMRELLDHAGSDRVHWVGNSLGGIIGLTLSKMHPHRLRTLAIFGTALALDLPSTTARLLPIFDAVPGRAAMARVTAWSTTTNRAARPLIESLLRQYNVRAAAAIVGHIRRYDLRDAAARWSGPGMVLVGGRDGAVNRVLKGQLAPLRQHRNWQVVDLPSGGHCANLDATEGWRSALLRLWASASSADAVRQGRA